MKKIAFIIVRYGENINGGAEVHCQMLAERLLPYYEVEVLTTTIRAFNHPDQDYTEGVSSWNGVTIRRFKPQPIDQEQFRPFRKKYKTRPHRGFHTSHRQRRALPSRLCGHRGHKCG